MGGVRFGIGQGLLGSTLAIAAVVLTMAMGTTHYLAQVAVRTPAEQAARRVAALPDPETTGSLRHAADATRLDPCRVRSPM